MQLKYSTPLPVLYTVELVETGALDFIADEDLPMIISSSLLLSAESFSSSFGCWFEDWFVSISWGLADDCSVL